MAKNHGVELIPVTVFDNAFRHYNLTLTLHLYLQITVRNIKLQFPWSVFVFIFEALLTFRTRTDYHAPTMLTTTVDSVHSRLNYFQHITLRRFLCTPTWLTHWDNTYVKPEAFVNTLGVKKIFNFYENFMKTSIS